ncbi:MAG: hypothetical protein U0136_03635 [Bdellovibrionota bacterium]
MAADRNRVRPETAIFIAHEDYNKRDVAEAEKNLMRAILQTAMEDIRKKGEVYRDARRYFTSKDEYYLYSFLSICYHLDLCHRTIRTVIGLGDESTPSMLAEPAPEASEDKVAA